MSRKVKKTLVISAAIVAAMFAFSFALVPLYNMICKTTGINGKFDTSVVSPRNSDLLPDTSRTVTVQFISIANENLPWDFYPETVSITTHPEENARVMFVAKNNSNQTITVQAIPNITPSDAVKHFHKIECFCFRKQTLKPGQSIRMPVVFRLDKKLPQDINTISLAYTLFDVTKGMNHAKNHP